MPDKESCARQSLQAYKNFDHLLTRGDVAAIVKRCKVSKATVCRLARLYRVRLTRGACGITAPKKGGDFEDKIIFRGGSREAERALSAQDTMRLFIPGRAMGFGSIIGVP